MGDYWTDPLSARSRLSLPLYRAAETVEDSYELVLPARLKRCGIETRLIIEAHSPSAVHDRTRQALQGALAKALAWNQMMIDGEVASMATLARLEGVSQRHIAHVIKLAFLAPDIMYSIVKGAVPHDLTLTRLKKSLPLNWADQRKLLGFTA